MNHLLLIAKLNW